MMTMSDRVTKALLSYARLAPLDLKRPSDIQADLLAIAGRRHQHVRSIGSDVCLICMADRKDPVHLDPRDPDPTREGIFRDHNCARCGSGAKPCVNGNPLQCEYPHARND